MRVAEVAALVVAFSCGLGKHADATPVRIVVEIDGGHRQPLVGRLLLRPEPIGPQHQPLRTIEHLITLPGQREIELPTGTVWRAQVLAEGFWSDNEVLAVPSAASSLTLRLVQAGILHGLVDTPRGITATEIVIRLGTTGGPRRTLRPNTITCQIRDRSWRCAVPAGIHDAQFRVGRSVPIYRWSIRVRPAEATDLGTLRFQEGASLVGWIRTSDAAPLSQSCRVQLSVERRDDGAVDLARPLTLLNRQAIPNKDGFFQMSGVGPGRYLLTIEERGYAVARKRPIRVESGRETEILEPLVLERPEELSLALAPPLSPSRRPWHVRVVSRDDTYAGQADEDGKWRQKGVAIGSYTVYVGDTEQSRWVAQEIEVQSGQSELLVQVPVVAIRGRVKVGKEPVHAVLWFGGRMGKRRIRLETNQDGFFEGHLPEAGTWPLQLTAADVVQVTVDPVEVQSEGELDIRLPDTTLAGEVVDEAGTPVARAEVDLLNATKQRGGDRLQTDEEGRFKARGLPPGKGLLMAEAGTKSSDWVPFELSEGIDSPRLRLVVREALELKGRVVDGPEPVPGALIVAWPDLGTAEVGVTRGSSATSDAEGKFSLTAPPGLQALNLLVNAPGRAMRLIRVNVDRTKLIELVVTPYGGRLVVENQGGTGRYSPLIVHQGVFTTLSSLQRAQGRPALADDQRVIIESLEPGEYALCIGGAAATALRRGTAPPASACTNGTVPPLGELVLRSAPPSAPD